MMRALAISGEQQGPSSSRSGLVRCHQHHARRALAKVVLAGCRPGTQRPEACEQLTGDPHAVPYIWETLLSKPSPAGAGAAAPVPRAAL
mmetsp:Transcript_79937/g.238116  ORF Transcript_79937/g.238116 Transcript_79937/m.238116 type:complete len:89 (+) Transcript_79937:630-896(+)